MGDGTEQQIVPLRRQYLQIKARFPDTVLFFRLGDFYETFERDAEIAASVLDIVLTSREMGRGVRVPMAGIPHHAADGHIARLVAAGHKVAVCEQVGEVSKGKKLVERDVTRVVTPGTVTDPSMLDARSNNFIAAVSASGNRWGIAYADITTGEFRATEAEAETLPEALQAAGRELLRLQPAELILADDVPDTAGDSEKAWYPDGIALTRTEVWRWVVDRAHETLLRHFEVESLDGFGCAGKPLAVAAAGGLLAYLADTQVSGLRQLSALSTYSLASFMTLDAQTRRNLELAESSRGDKRHSLIAVLDQTRTPMGARLLRQRIGQPLLDPKEIDARLDRVQSFVDDALLRGEVRQILGRVGDIERLANRAMTGTASPRDLAVLRDGLEAVLDLRRLIGDVPGHPALPGIEDVVAFLQEALADDPAPVLGKGTVLRAGFAPELDGHRRRAREAQEWIAGLERAERERTGIKSLKVGYNKVFGYYLEVSAAALANAERERSQQGLAVTSPLPGEYIPKQTLSNATRYFTAQLKEFETIVLTAQETLAQLEADAFRRVVTQVAGAGARLLDVARTVAGLDVDAALAEVAVQRHYVRPVVDESRDIEIVAGRHPTLEGILPPGAYVANDSHLSATDQQIIILTGPNMAGKSSWLRQTALIVLLAQIGSFVPAERARIGLVDRIFTRIGAQDDIATGQSTFMVEMLETANILHHATPRSLIVLDEIGRGTSTFDGLAIARAIVEYIHNTPRLGSRTLFATHYHELVELERILPRVRTYRMDVLDDGQQIVFLRQVVPGGADRSYGLHVAHLAGIPRPVVRRAQEILDDLERADERGGGDAKRRAAVRRAPSHAENGQPTFQLTFFSQPNPVIEELQSLDVEGLSPLEAITKLFELKHRALAKNGSSTQG